MYYQKSNEVDDLDAGDGKSGQGLDNGIHGQGCYPGTESIPDNCRYQTDKLRESRTTNAERGPNLNAKRNAVLQTGSAIQTHEQRHDQR